MFKLRSIATRLILAITLTAAVACGVLGTFSIIQQRSLTRLALDQQLKLQYDSVMAALDYEGRAALAVSAVIANLPPVAEAVARDDRDALMALLGSSMKALDAQGIPLISFHTPPATAFFRVHAPKVFGEDISARRKTVVESNTTGKPIVGVEPGRELLSVFAMTPIMRGGKSLAVADIGVSFGKQFVDSAKQRFGVDLAVYRFDGKAFSNIASTLANSSVATPDELKSAFEGATLRRDATLNGHPAALYLGQIRNYAGQPVAVIELVKDTTEYEAAAASSQRHLIFGTAAIWRRHCAGVPARPRSVPPAGRDHRGDEPPFERRYRGDDPRQCPKRRAWHHGRSGRRVPPQHDRGAHDARGAGSLQAAG
jgi:methyl-accepting chemotaxis protein